MKIRLAKPKDKENVLKLLDELAVAVARRSGKVVAVNEGYLARSNFYDEVIRRDDVKIFVIEKNGNLVGLAELFIVPIIRRGWRQGVVESFVITEKLRGKGVGSALFKKIKEFCQQNNIKVIKLTSSLELTEAHKFYEKHGGKFTEKMFRFDLV